MGRICHVMAEAETGLKYLQVMDLERLLVITNSKEGCNSSSLSPCRNSVFLIASYFWCYNLQFYKKLKIYYFKPVVQWFSTFLICNLLVQFLMLKELSTINFFSLLPHICYESECKYLCFHR